MARKPAVVDGLDPAATYRLALSRPVATPAMTYRPGEDLVINGAAIRELAAYAEVPVDDLGEVRPVEDLAIDGAGIPAADGPADDLGETVSVEG